MGRREFLASLGLVGLGGCLRLSDEADSSGATDDRTPRASTTTTGDDDAEGATPTEAGPRLSIAASWPEFQYDPANTGHHPDTTGPTEPVERVWSFERTGSVPASRERTTEWPAFNPVVAAGRVFVTSQDDTVYAIDAETGEEAWRFSADVSVEDAGRKCTPVHDDGTVYAEGPGGYLYALDVERGDRRWRALNEQNAIPARPTVVDGTLYLSDNQLLAIDAGNGSLEWKHDKAAHAAVADDTVYLSDNKADVYAHHVLQARDRNTGAERWTRELFIQVPTVADGLVFGGTWAVEHTDQSPAFYALDAADGRTVWKKGLPVQVSSTSAAVADGRVFVGTGGGTLSVYAAETGEVLWEFTPLSAGGLRGSPAVVDGHVYVSDTAGTVHCLDVDGTKKWAYRFDEGTPTAPAVVDDAVFVATRDGRVHALAAAG